jgi:urea carboxylase
MVEYDMKVMSPAALLAHLARLDAGLPSPDSVTLPSRILRLPMAFDDSCTRAAIDKYMKRYDTSKPYLQLDLQQFTA